LKNIIIKKTNSNLALDNYYKEVFRHLGYNAGPDETIAAAEAAAQAAGFDTVDAHLLHLSKVDEDVNNKFVESPVFDIVAVESTPLKEKKENQLAVINGGVNYSSLAPISPALTEEPSATRNITKVDQLTTTNITQYEIKETKKIDKIVNKKIFLFKKIYQLEKNIFQNLILSFNIQSILMSFHLM